MKFKIKVDDKNIELKKKILDIDIDSGLDNCDIFEKVLDYIKEKYDTIFKLYGESYFDFTVTKGKIWQSYTASYDECPRCGGHLEIWFDEKNYEDGDEE